MAALTKDQIKTIFAKSRKAQTNGQFAQAEAGYKRLLAGGAALAEVYFNLAEIFAVQNRTREAGASFEAAIKLRPAEHAIWNSYLHFAARLENLTPFEKILKRVETAAHRLPDLSYFRAIQARREGRYSDAEALLLQTLNANAQALMARIEFAGLLEDLERNDEALTQYDAALALQPRHDLAISRKAVLLRNLGRVEDALEFTRAALARLPEMDFLYYNYASIRKVAADDPIIAQAQQRLSKLKKSHPGAEFLNMALAKAMEDTGQSDKVFTYLKPGNQMRAKRYPYDFQTDLAQMRAVRDRYAELDISQLKTGPDNIAPIFISGLPRSGTTLVEQIIASHSRVTGGGEVGILAKPLLAEVLEGEMNANALAGVAADYSRDLAQRFPNADRITDKSINTHVALGFARIALPSAKFIVVRRDPRDNALSIYKSSFAEGQHRYANNLRDIARFIRLSEQQIAFWKDQCPDVICEIRYEDLIANPEAIARALITHAGLDWEDQCLSFYDNTRKVKTLSSVQVRQPIYSSSVGAWKTYSRELQPFLDEYGAIDPAYDV